MPQVAWWIRLYVHVKVRRIAILRRVHDIVEAQNGRTIRDGHVVKLAAVHGWLAAGTVDSHCRGLLVGGDARSLEGVREAVRGDVWQPQRRQGVGGHGSGGEGQWESDTHLVGVCRWLSLCVGNKMQNMSC